MPAVRKSRAMMSSAIRPLIEHLESRELLTTVTSTSATTPTFFEYQDARGQAVRVTLEGNIKVDLVGSNVNPDTNAVGLNGLPGDLISAGGTRTRVGGGFGGENGIMPVTALNQAARTVNENAAPATEDITDIPSVPDTDPNAPAGARVGGDDGLGSIKAPSTSINFDAIASNSAGETFGFNVTTLAATTIVAGQAVTVNHLAVQLVEFNNANGNATVIEDLNRDDLPGTNGFGQFLISSITTTSSSAGPGTTTITQTAPVIASADFYPSDDSKLYFVATVSVLTSNGTSLTAVQEPRLFLYDFTKPLGHRVTALPGAFGSTSTGTGTGSTTSTIYGMTFNPNDNHMWVFATIPNPNNVTGQVATKTALFDLGDPTTTNFNTDSIGGNAITVRNLTTAQDIEFLGNGPGDINNDPNGIYIVSGTNLFRADISVGFGNATTAVDFGPLPDPDDTRTPPRGANITDITYNPTILNPFFLEDDPTSTRRGVFIGTDAATDELVYIDFRNRHPDSDLYTLYVTKADPNGSSTDGKISIATFARGTTNHSPLTETESPYGTGVSLRVLTQGGTETTVTPGIGGVLLGAQSVHIGTATTGINAGGVPFNTATVPANTFATLPNTISTLAPGLIVAPGVSLNKFLFGGTITGQVAVADSINLFYAGGIVTGDASGGEFNNGIFFGSGTVFSFTGLNNLVNPGNFSFGGELRNLVVGNDVGISGDPTSTKTYSSGFNMHIVGRLGEEHVYGNAALNGVVDGLDNSHSLPGNIPQEEIEFKGVVGTPNPHGPVSDFQNFFLSTDDVGAATPVPFANDTTPQFLGTFNSTIFDGLNQAQNDAIQVRGVLQNDAPLNAGDGSDEYSIGLLAGQSYQFTLRQMQYPGAIAGTIGNVGTVITSPGAGVLDEPDPTTWVYGGSGIQSLSLEVIDPLGNVIASDFNDVDAAETFGQVGFKATIPGNYTLQVSADVVTILPTGVRVVTTFGGDQPYELVGANVGNITLGAVHGNGFVGDVANPLLLTGTIQQGIVHQTPGLELTHGSMGMLVSDGILDSLSTDILVGAATTQTSTATLQIDNGNLGGVLALNIGNEDTAFGSKAEEGNGDFGEGIALHVSGIIGLIHNTDTTQTAVMDINRDASAAMAYEVQEILATGLLYGNIYTNGPIGVIKAGDFGVALGPVMLINTNFDNTGNDGTIDLIETTGDARNPGNFGTLEDGGPGITTGPGGNVRYIRSAGTLFRDAFFGGSQPEITTYTAGATVNLVDDSGSTVSIIPGPLVPNPFFNPLLPIDPVTNPQFVGAFQNTSAATTVNGVTTVGGAVASASTGTLTTPTTGTTGTTGSATTLPAAEHVQVETYPIRGSGGAVIVRLITDGGITLTSGARATNGGVEISDLEVEQPINFNNIAIDGNPVTLDVNNNPVVGVASPAGTGTTNIPTTGAGSSKSSPTLPTKTTSTNSSGNTGTTTTVTTTTATGTTITLNQAPIALLFNGSGRIDIFNILGNDVDSITNSTGGEIVNADLKNLGVLTTNGNVGFSISPATGVDVSASSHTSTNGTWPTGVYPINNQTSGILVAGNVVAIRSTGAIGNVVVGALGTGTNTSRTTTTGNIGEVTANSNNISAPGVFRGIEGNIVASNRINFVNIGEGILPSGTGDQSQAGIYALGPLGIVQNNVGGGDIRGNVVSTTSIGAINLRNASLIDANVDVFTDLSMAADHTTGARTVPNFNQPVNNPIFQIGSINVSGNGGIIGTQVQATSIGPVNVGGFGIFDSTFATLGDGVMNGIHAGGYGIRKALFNGGASIGSITANTSGAQLPTSSVSADVRQSEFTSMDPFFFITPNKLTDIHATLGTSAFTPVINGETNQGILEDVVALGSRTLGSVSAFQIRGSQPQQAISGVDQPTDASFFRFGNSIGSITTTSIINGLKVTTGAISNFKPGSDVLSSSITVSSKIKAIKINGSLANNSMIQTVGANSTIGSITIKNDLDGSISTTGKIGTITIGGNLNGKLTILPTNFSKNSLDKLTVNGAIISGSFNVQGSVGQIITMGSLGQTGDSIVINGNLNSLIVGKSKFSNATLNANITVLGNLKSMTVYGAMNGALTVNGSVGNLSVYADAASSGQKILTNNVNVSGGLNKLLVSGGGISGNVSAFGVNNATISFGNLEPLSSIISGSFIKSLLIKGGNLFGTVRAEGGDINTINVDGSIGNGVNPMTISANNIKSVHAGGSMFSQAEIDTGVLGQLFLGGDFDSGAIIRANSIGKTTILGANNGQIIIS